MAEPLATVRSLDPGGSDPGSSAAPAATAATSEEISAFRAIRTVRAADTLATLARSGSPLAGRVRTVRELATAVPPEPIAWSPALGATLPSLARLVPAGLPQGELVELVGRRSAGRLGATLALLAAATSSGENAALVDLGDGFDPNDGALHGIDLARLLWARPTHLKPALAAAESLLAGGFPLVVVELGLPPVAGGRGVEAHWLRLARAARDTRALAIVSSPYRVAGFAAPLALELSAPHPRWRGAGREPRLLAGIDARLELVRGGHTHRHLSHPIHSSHSGRARARAVS